MPTRRWIAALTSWCLLLGVYLALEGQIAADELAAGAIAAAAGTALAEVLHRRSHRELCPLRLPWPRLLGQTAMSLVTDTFAVGWILTWRRPPAGVVLAESFTQPPGPCRQAACRAVLVLCRSVAPATFAIGVLDHRGQLLLHHLTGDGA